MSLEPAEPAPRGSQAPDPGGASIEAAEARPADKDAEPLEDLYADIDINGADAKRARVDDGGTDPEGRPDKALKDDKDGKHRYETSCGSFKLSCAGCAQLRLHCALQH
jgi:hypothetical protein